MEGNMPKFEGILGKGLGRGSENVSSTELYLIEFYEHLHRKEFPECNLHLLEAKLHPSYG